MKSTYFGLTSFEKALHTRAQAYTLVQNTLFPVILGFEYYPVIHLSHDHPLSEEISQLQNLGFQVIESEGESSQLHSPGQLVIYPLVPLTQLQLSKDLYLQVLNDSLLSWLKALKIEAHADSQESISTSRGQIASIDTNISAGISQQSLTINVGNDLSLLGRSQISQTKEDSIAQHGIPVDLKAAFDTWISHFTAHLLSAMPSSSGSEN